MCNKDCCALKTALQYRMMKRLAAKELEEELAKPIPKVVATPQASIYTYEDIKAMADFIINRTNIKPKFGLVCGTNLDTLVDLIEDPIVFDYADIPKFPLCTAYGHKGKLFVGTVRGATVIAMQGRFHYYEGNQLASCTMPVRVMKLCGVEYVFLTCASGSINLGYNVGDVLLIKDHINLLNWLGNSPLIGTNETRFGQRHLFMAHAYDRKLLEKALEIGKEIGFQDCLHEGVYASLGGPCYETQAEQKFLRQIGIDAVGMSLVNEVVVARHCSMKVFACTLIVVAALEHVSFSEELMIDHGQDACKELIGRLIYNIQNDLIDTPTLIDKLMDDNII